MGEAMLLILLIGVFLGIGFGRWRAENHRARYDQYRVWNTRKDYRDY